MKKRHGIDIKAYHSLTRHDGTTKTILWVGALEEIGRDLIKNSFLSAECWAIRAGAFWLLVLAKQNIKPNLGTISNMSSCSLAAKTCGESIKKIHHHFGM
ncbi:MAG: hypothetical protein JRJ37_11030 [Deltaproteobacteria bacterium]|nr:hypothetical protein [Deltaproteobacteria bacterium]